MLKVTKNLEVSFKQILINLFHVLLKCVFNI
jgi:hypothetical protein